MHKEQVCAIPYRQRHIVQQNVEARSSPREVVPHELGNHISLGDQLAGVELSDDALEHLVDDGGEDALVVVLAEGAVDLGEGLDIGPGEHTAGDVDHLEVLGAGQRGDVPRLGANVVDDWRLEPRDDQMGSCCRISFEREMGIGMGMSRVARTHLQRKCPC